MNIPIYEFITFLERNYNYIRKLINYKKKAQISWASNITFLDPESKELSVDDSVVLASLIYCLKSLLPLFEAHLELNILWELHILSRPSKKLFILCCT